MILSALWRALPQIFHPAARRVLARTLALTLALFAAAGAAAWLGLRAAFAWMGWDRSGMAGATLAVLVAIIAGWFLYRAVAIAVMGLFSDAIVAAVEAESYPDASARAQPPSWGRGMTLALRSVARTLGWNLVALPLYIGLLVTGVGTVALFLGLNGYLLGRDLAEMVEARHPALPPIPAGRRWLMGLVSALMFLVPVANLLAPIWSAAMAVHILHGRREKDG